MQGHNALRNFCVRAAVTRPAGHWIGAAVWVTCPAGHLASAATSQAGYPAFRLSSAIVRKSMRRSHQSLSCLEIERLDACPLNPAHMLVGVRATFSALDVHSHNVCLFTTLFLFLNDHASLNFLKAVLKGL